MRLDFNLVIVDDDYADIDNKINVTNLVDKLRDAIHEKGFTLKENCYVDSASAHRDAHKRIDLYLSDNNLGDSGSHTDSSKKNDGIDFYLTLRQQKYLCDYTINIPIFSNDPTNNNICEHLIKNYKNIIIYCNTQKEGKTINDLMNKLQHKCSAYIDCHTPKKTRNIIIDKYKKGEITFLVNVRILVEGFDALLPKEYAFYIYQL